LSLPEMEQRILGAGYLTRARVLRRIFSGSCAQTSNSSR
jgi:hypothetical protein